MIEPEILSTRVPALRSLPGSALRRLAMVATERRLRAGAAIFRAGDRPAALHFVLAGRVRVVQARDGRTRVVHWEESGGTLGEVPTFGDEAFPVTAFAYTAVQLARVSGIDVRRLAVEESSLATFFLARLARRAATLLEQLEALRGATVTARLARHLLARSIEVEGGDFTLGMSQTALAEELGTVREVVVRSLGALRRSGALVQPRRGRYRVQAPETLRALLG